MRVVVLALDQHSGIAREVGRRQCFETCGEVLGWCCVQERLLLLRHAVLFAGIPAFQALQKPDMSAALATE